MEDYKEFKNKLFGRLSTGNYTVMVQCANDIKFPADVVGWSEEYMTVKVRFHSDKLTKPSLERVYNNGLGMDEESYELLEVQIPVRVEDIWWKSIIL